VRYLLDTNVVSELRKGPACAPAVASWASSVESADLSMSVLAIGEIRHGIDVLRRRGDRKQAEIFAAWLNRLKSEFADRFIAVSGTVAERWGELPGTSPLPPIDGLMVATALEHDLTFVTRDTVPLVSTGVRLLNPWGD
jgi:predicted nucleic acid-binding protein